MVSLVKILEISDITEIKREDCYGVVWENSVGSS